MIDFEYRWCGKITAIAPVTSAAIAWLHDNLDKAEFQQLQNTEIVIATADFAIVSEAIKAAGLTLQPELRRAV